MSFKSMSAELRSQFDAKDLTEERLSGLINSFIDATEKGDHVAKGVWVRECVCIGVCSFGCSFLSQLGRRLQRLLSRTQPEARFGASGKSFRGHLIGVLAPL